MTVSNNTNRFVQTLNTVLQNGQKEREKILSYLTAAVTQITKTREERDAALVQLREVNTKYKTATEQIRHLQQVNQRLEHDVQTMMSALDAATREFAQSDAQMVDRVVALGSEINLPGFSERRQQVETAPRTAAPAQTQGVATQRRAVVRGAPVSTTEFSTDEDVNRRLEELGRLLNTPSAPKRMPLL
ncbi:hypothetical protein [Mesorhizobium sp. SP-1A]|uniref:hypothetical protein n=1 Tax=Mesorhizobium sp. SP-1A TaxID=3077840 RepID=UPI0028F6DB30|nr:hypothetical protein [Mesorhizobium sp. SP-1A]